MSLTVFNCVQIFYTDLDRTNWSAKMVVFSGESLHPLLGRQAVSLSSWTSVVHLGEPPSAEGWSGSTSLPLLGCGLRGSSQKQWTLNAIYVSLASLWGCWKIYSTSQPLTGQPRIGRGPCSNVPSSLHFSPLWVGPITLPCPSGSLIAWSRLGRESLLELEIHHRAPLAYDEVASWWTHRSWQYCKLKIHLVYQTHFC